MFSNFKKIIYVFIFLTIVIAPMVSWYVLSHIDDKSIINKLDFDLNEKRLKATFSEPINIDTIGNEIENYYNDRLPYRSILITSKNLFDDFMERPYKEVLEKKLIKIFSKKKNVINAKDYTEEIDGKTYRFMDEAVDLYRNHALAKDEIDAYDDAIEYPLQISENNLVITGQSNWLYLNVNNIPYYTGDVVIPTDEEMSSYVSDIVNLDKVCKELGKKLVILMCPEKEEIYPEYMPTMDVKNEKELAIYMRDYLKENTEVKFIYPKEEFLNYKKKYLLYQKYDTHWNLVGAYLGVTMVENALGMETTPLHEMSLKKEKTNVGDLIPLSGNTVNGLAEYTDYKFDNYKLDNEVEVEKIVDKFDANSTIYRCKNGVDEKAFVIGDSYSGRFVDFAKKDFNTLYASSYLNLDMPFLPIQVKDADDIILVFVERNESSVLRKTVKKLYSILSEEISKK